MYRRLSIRLLCLALITFFSLPAFAQYTRDNAASKKIDEAINEHYLATDFDKAEGVLTGTINACGDKCSPGVIAKAWMYVGIVRGSGKNDQGGAKAAFQKALSTDPTVKLDTQLATPETQKTFADLGGAGGVPAATPAPAAAAPAAASAPNEDAGDKGGLKCTPDVRELQTRRPIPMDCSSDEEVASMEIRYKPFGEEAWKTVKMKKVGEDFQGEVPCDATGSAGTLKLYVRAKDASGENVDSFGSKAKPIEFVTSEDSNMEPPAYPGAAAPTRCLAKEECPPDFPGCGAKHGEKEAGASCTASNECKDGLLCNDGTCETPPACDSNADCGTGTCVDNKCTAGDDAGAALSHPYKKNWIGLHFAQDIAIVGGSDVCSVNSRANNGYMCDIAGTSEPFNGDPRVGAGIGTGTVLATHRILLSFDHGFSPNVTLGARIGFAFGGGPKGGVDANGRPNTTTPSSFLPAHAELRLAYWFGKGALGKKGLRPYVHVGGGLAQVDAKVKNISVADCDRNTDGSLTSNTDYNNCQLGTNDNVPHYQLDAWRRMGQFFVTAGGGLVYAFKENIGAQLNINLMYMLPSAGPVIQPSLGVIYGF